MSKTSYLNPFKAIKYLFDKPQTLRYPFETKEIADRYRGFHKNDWEKCTGCGNCADICPNKAITMVKIDQLEAKPEKGIKDERPQLDYGRCCFCGLCVDICPPGSLTLTKDFFHIHFDTNTFTFIPKDEKLDKETYKSEKDYSIFQASLGHRKENYDGFSPDMRYALFEPDRVEMPEIEPDERKLSFIEQVIGYNKEQAMKEAERCLECKLCEDACPANLKISEYIDAIYKDKPKESLEKIYEDNPIPSICGRICMKHCEDACSLHIRGEALAIRWIKRYAADQIKNFKEELEIHPGKPTGKKVGIIGAGPSGLSLAYFLRLQGHEVIVYDDLPGGGGTVRIGPPTYRLPLEAIDKDVNYIESLGVKFKFNTKVGKDIEFEKILSDNDAVFIGIGNTVSFSTRVKNSEKCILALDFLKNNKIGEQRKVGKEVIVIGGGNVAMDVARESIRLQYMQYPDEEVIIKTVSLEDWNELPASEEEIKESKEEGIQFNPAWGPKEVILDADGNIKGLLCKKVKSVFDEKGRFSPKFIEGMEKLLKGDMIIEAIGQRADFSFLPDELKDKLEFTKRRKVSVDENGMTSIPKVFAGGDIVNLNLDAVTAIADAKVAAKGIDRFLSNK
ncbi:MAG: FAD-dependent oxidoreductase [Candidatus Caldatribacteriota bacterium]|nr:FAD-dependent oxidoreductase [Candidatus Caldatribacteriota bacterium]